MSEVAALEKQRADCLESVQDRDDILSLMSNDKFKRVILQRYCVEECARYVSLSLSSQLSQDQRQVCLLLAQGTRALRDWLQAQVQLGNVAEATIPKLEAELVSASSEEDRQ